MAIKEYETGAKRDDDADNVRYDLIPRAGIERLAATLAEGARKYSPDNWRAGFRWRQTANHALRHVYAWLDGDASEDHLGHAMASLAFLCEFEKTHPELDDRYKLVSSPLVADPSGRVLHVDPTKNHVVGAHCPLCEDLNTAPLWGGRDPLVREPATRIG